ncbi:1, 4-beta cellobiohydrolase [Nannochloropsis gaditana]|uniref:1, 4-beta cellobiohydrolase n=1 Tax=Nannochloropsis gaditana TaxID=72520 RepID=W7T9H7_9STRA|nr:1, 4-beta cellobiohydrolase [Nannochloropsis gaditana]
MPRLFVSSVALVGAALFCSSSSLAHEAKTVEVTTRSAKPKGENIFKGAEMYVNPYFQEELDSSIKTASGEVKKTLQSIRGLSSAYWLDVKSKVG